MTDTLEKDTIVGEPVTPTSVGLLSTKELLDLKNQLLSDPLAQATRKVRRFLLGSSLGAFASAKAGLIPTKIAAVGIESDQINANWFFFILGILVLYFWITFVIYVISDIVLRRHIARISVDTPGLQIDSWSTLIPSTLSVRIFFDVVFPVLFGLFGMFCAFSKLPTSFWRGIF